MTETNENRLDEVRDFIVNDFRRDEYPIKFYQDLAFLVHQAKRVQELEFDLNICQMSKKTIGYINRFTDEIKDENKRLREALEFYANRQAYYYTSEHPSEVMKDYGEIARQALEGESK